MHSPDLNSVPTLRSKYQTLKGPGILEYFGLFWVWALSLGSILGSGFLTICDVLNLK